MRAFRANSSIPDRPAAIHPALTSFADECCATLARLVAYVGMLALLVIVGLHLWNELPEADAPESAVRKGWSLALRSHPAFAVSSFDLSEKTEAYEIFRHPEGGRKDVLHWSAEGDKPVAELEIYRPGGEFDPDAASAEIVARINPVDTGELETAGVIDSKFGTVTLLRVSGRAEGPKSCLGFIKRLINHLGDADLQISGWSCRGDGLPARRAIIGCMFDRLTLLTAGNEPNLAELFARAELKRGTCTGAAPSPTSLDWVTATENPRLRGRL
jgi:hypothetical protein